MKILDEIRSSSVVLNDNNFFEFLNFFKEDEFKNFRKDLYNEKIQEGFTLLEAKYFYIKSIFGGFVSFKLRQALYLSREGNVLESKKIVDKIHSLKNLFRDTDLISFESFLLDVDENLNNIEAKLLFEEPELNKEELNQISEALEKSLIKNVGKIESKDEFKEKFLDHPLMNCLTLHNDFSSLLENIDDNLIKVGFYKDLVQALMSLKLKMNDEIFQGFLTFLISEDLTVGFNKVLKTEEYKPIFLKKILDMVSKGESLNNQLISNLAYEIKNYYTDNFQLNSFGNLVEKISSNQSLNDYGHMVKLKFNDKDLFFHGHASSNSGANQHEQHNNSGFIFRNFKNCDTLGLTILRKSSGDINNRNYLKDYQSFSNFNEIEKIALCNLQFDRSFFKTLSLKENVKNLKNSDLLSSNFFIAENNLDLCKKYAKQLIGQNDFDLLLEKKSLYCYLFEKNKDFFGQIFKTTGSNNEYQYQLIALPVLEIIENLLDIEDSLEIKIFNENELETVKNLLKEHSNNVDLQSYKEKLEKNIKLRERNNENLKNLNIDSEHLIKFIKKFDVIENKKDKKEINNNFFSSILNKDNFYEIKNLLLSDLEIDKKLLLNKKIEKKIVSLLMSLEFDSKMSKDVKKFFKLDFKPNIVFSSLSKEENINSVMTFLFSSKNKTSEQKEISNRIINYFIIHSQFNNYNILSNSKNLNYQKKLNSLK